MEEVEKAEQQRIHDARVEDDFCPELEEDRHQKPLSGIKLENMSLTTIKYMRQAGSKMLKGVKPTDMEDAQREIAVYFLAHDPTLSIKERSHIFRKGGDDLEDALDDKMHNAKIGNIEKLFMAVATRIEKEAATMAVPVEKKDSKDNESGN